MSLSKISDWFKTTGARLKELGIKYIWQIMNADETQLNLTMKDKELVLTFLGKRPVKVPTLALNEHITAMPFICADGSHPEKVPLIVPSKNLPSVEDTTIWNYFQVYHQDNGWIDSPTLRQIIDLVCPFIAFFH